MAINPNIWGDPENYRDYQHDTDIIVDVKLPRLSKSSFYKTYSFNAPENIDLSISPWGIGGGSWLCHTYGIACWIQNAGDANPYDRENGFNLIHYDFDKYAGRQHPMILYSAYTEGGTFIVPNENTGKMPNTYRYFPQPSQDAASYSGQQPLTSAANYTGWRRTPIVSFMYKNMILIPYIIGIAKNSGASVFTMYLDDFCNNTANTATTDNITGWRANNVHIIGIGYMFANGNPNDRNLSDDQSNLYCIGTQLELKNYTPPEPWFVEYLPPAAGNYPTEAKHVVIPSYTGQSGIAYHYTTCLTTLCDIRAWNDINSSPINYWYGKAYEDYSIANQIASAYFTGGENWKPACYVPGSDVPPTNGSTPKRYMYWDITTISDDDVRAELWRQVAFLGFCFTTDHTKYNGTVGENIELCMPVFDSTGCTTGEYKIGLDCKTLDNYLWTNDAWEKNSAYDPSQHAGSDEDFGQLDNSEYRGINLLGSCKYYALSESELNSFIGFLNGLYITDTDTTQLDLDFKGSNPNDYIVGIYAYPFDIPAISTAENIKIGPVESTVNVNRVEQQAVGAFTFGHISIPEYYGDFRDYKPYTTLELYLPLAGSIELDPAFYIGHTLEIQGTYDINTGVCTYKLLRDSITLDRTIDCSIGCQIPVTARNMGDFQNNIHQIRMSSLKMSLSGMEQSYNQAVGTISAGIAGASGGSGSGAIARGISSGGTGSAVFDAAGSVVNALDIKYQLTHSPCKLAVTSTADTHNAFNLYGKAILFIKRSKMLDAYNSAEYSHVVGNACAIPGKLGSFSGYTVAAAADLSGIAATAEEKNMIKKLLQSGVYV